MPHHFQFFTFNLQFQKYKVHMEYSKLVSISGMSGLFELISSKADGGVVRSLEDKSTKFVSNRKHNFSHLEGIEVYTVKDNVNLTEVLTAMKDSKEKVPDQNGDPKAIRAYFEKVFPDMDFERVYGSDMKKMIKWLDILTNNNIEIKLSERSSEESMSDSMTDKKNVNNAQGGQKTSAVRSAPPKKINAPRKIA
jgi:hypothetical protein